MTPNKIDFGIDELNHVIHDIDSGQAAQAAYEVTTAQSAAASIAFEPPPLSLLDASIRPQFRARARRSSSMYREAASRRDSMASDQLDEEQERGHSRDRSLHKREDPDMANQLANLESLVGDIRVDMGKVETKLEYIEKNMLTKGRAAVIALGVGVGVFAGGWWVVQQYLSPILKATGTTG